MPRFYYQEIGSIDPNDPIDLCNYCWGGDDEEIADELDLPLEHVEASREDAGPDGHDHPDYSDENYDCEICLCSLGDEDN
ncbi:MAG: hypothetical protein ACYS7Y_33510 [Planctomycetota bacterium]|jgi:hypothetical protein